MSNSSDTTGCISHRPKTRFFIMFEDYQDIARAASGKEHENKLAAFWRVLETKTNDRITELGEVAEEYKKKDQPIPEDLLWIEIPYSEFENRSRGIFKSSSFQIAAAESERVGFSKSRVRQRPRNPDDPNSPKEDYKEYLFFFDLMQSVLNGGELPTPIEINSPLLKSHNERKEEKKRKRAIEKNSTPLLKTTEGAIENNNNKYNKVSSKDNKEESVCDPVETLPPREDTHTSFENSSSSSEHIAEPPTQQTHSVGTAMSTAPRTPAFPSVSPPSGVRGVSLQDHNRVGSPPADDKSQTNKPVLSQQELALRRKWAKYVSEDVTRETVIIALQLRSAWLEAYGAYGDAEWDNQAILWLAQQDNGTWENIQKVYALLQDESINPEKVKNNWYRLNKKSKANVSAASSALMPPRVKTREELRREAY